MLCKYYLHILSSYLQSKGTVYNNYLEIVLCTTLKEEIRKTQVTNTEMKPLLF